MSEHTSRGDNVLTALGRIVTAEGIETAAQADQVRAIGCGTGQGFHSPGRDHPS